MVVIVEIVITVGDVSATPASTNVCMRSDEIQRMRSGARSGKEEGGGAAVRCGTPVDVRRNGRNGRAGGNSGNSGSI